MQEFKCLWIEILKVLQIRMSQVTTDLNLIIIIIIPFIFINVGSY